MSHVMPTLIQMAYLAATVLFILGLHNLRSPASAIGGNRLAAVGMLIAVLATTLDRAVLHVELMLLAAEIILRPLWEISPKLALS